MSEEQTKPPPDNNAIADAISTLGRAVAHQDVVIGNWLLALKLDSGVMLPLRCILAIGVDACDGLEAALKAAVKAGTIPPVIVDQAGTAKGSGAEGSP